MLYYRQLFYSKKYRKLADEISKKLINGKKVEEDLLMYYGFVMLEIGKPQKCIKCLNNLLKETYKLERTRYYKYMGLAHYMLGDYKNHINFFLN